MVKNEELYKTLTNNSLRAYNRSIKQQNSFTDSMKKHLLILKEKYIKKDGSYKWEEMAINEPLFEGIPAARLRANIQHLMRKK